MQTSTSSLKPPLPGRLEQRLVEHRAEVSRLREQYGDPREALFAFIRERFDRSDFLPEPSFGVTHHDRKWEDVEDRR